MPKYVVYEIWTRSRVIEATDESDAYDKGEPSPRDNFNLSNWHVVPVGNKDVGFAGGLNYRQVSNE